MATATFTKTGTKATTAAKLDAKIFSIEVTSHALLKQAYLAYLANGRTVNAFTQTREHVRGGGKKPWKQKGTGRARAGTIRSPLWRGGAVVFGPTGNESFAKKLPTKTKHTAIKQALSVKNADNVIKVIDDIVSKDGKTKELHALLTKIDSVRGSLLVVDSKEEMVVRALNNIPEVKMVQASYLNVYDILNARSIVFTKKALDATTAWLGGKK